MHERGLWTVQDDEIIFKSKAGHSEVISNPAMIIDMVSGILHKFGEKNWVSSHYRHLAATYGEDSFKFAEFPENWDKDMIASVVNFSCSTSCTTADGDVIGWLFSPETEHERIIEFVSELQKKGF